MGPTHATSTKARGTSALVAGCLALGLGACGDDTEETTGAETGSDTTALTKDAYIEQASEICADTNRELEQGGSPQAGLARIEQGMRELRQLPAPEGDEAQVDEMLAALERATELDREAQAGTGDTQVDPYEDFQGLAQQYGIEGGCVNAEP